MRPSDTTCSRRGETIRLVSRIKNSLHILRNDCLCRYAYHFRIKKDEPLSYSVDDSLDDLRNLMVGDAPILMCGHMFIDHQLDYVRILSNIMANHQFIIIDERCTRDGHVPSGRKITQESENLWRVCVPDILWKDTYRRFVNVPVQNDTGKEYCEIAVENLRRRHYDMGRGYPELIIHDSYRYAENLIDILKPSLVVLWNQFHAFHVVFKGVCNEYGIPTMYMEFGLLPHTYSFDWEGQMGRSHIAISKQTPRLPDKSDTAIFESVIGGWVKDMDMTTEQKGSRRKHRVLYIGQNDCESGIVPYTDDSKRFHSPIFHDSMDCLRFLSSICRTNEWDLTYRPHPIYANFEMMRGCYKLADVDCKSRIEDQMMQSDVIVTILSKSAYMALALDKPVVMLGYTQLRDKGCTYEAFDLESIEPAIQNAISGGRTERMKESFVTHVADLASSYLYDDCSGYKVGLSPDTLSSVLAEGCSKTSVGIVKKVVDGQ